MDSEPYEAVHGTYPNRRDLDGRTRAWLTSRRVPGSDQVNWAVALESLAEPAVRAAVATAITDPAAELGLAPPPVRQPAPPSMRAAG